MAAQAATAPDLRSAANFSVLAGTALTCTTSTVTGPVGINFSPPPTFTDTQCQQMQVEFAPGAYADFIKAYGAIAADLLPCKVLSGTLDGARLGPGTYCFTAGAALTGTLTLTGNGPWLFEIGTTGGALTTTNFTVVGDNPCNAFWWVQADVTTTDSTLQGTILGGGDITLTRTILDGRAWATHAMTMTDSNIFGCAGATGHGNGKEKCNQGVGNGPEGCDPGNSDNKHTSNDELVGPEIGTQGDPGRQPER